MGRAIIARSTAAAGVATRGVPDGDAPPAAETDQYADRLLKLIPAEVISVYISMTMILQGSATASDDSMLPWIVFAFGAFATWFYMRVTLKVTDWRQLLMTVLAFCVWAFAMGEPFTSALGPNWTETHAGLLLAAYTFIAPKIPMGEDG